MRKIIYFSLLFVFFAATPLVLAQTASPSSLVNQASPSVVPNTAFVKTLTSFMARLKAAVARADKISQRIATRLTKLRLAGQATAGNDKLIKFEARQRAFAIQLEQLKIDLAQMDLTSEALSTSKRSQKDYLIFKNQVLAFTKKLKDVYELELDLVADMKTASTGASPTVQAPAQ